MDSTERIFEEKREPFPEEIRALDCYWSDEYRRGLFSKIIKEIEFEDGYYRTPMETTYQSYLDTREELYNCRELEIQRNHRFQREYILLWFLWRSMMGKEW